MIYRKKDEDFILDDIILSDFDESSEQLQHLINVDCALALSICKTRNLPSCVFVLSLLYMKRLRSLHSLTSLTEIDNLTTKELYLIATLLANKYLIDEGETEQIFNSELVDLAGMNIERINLIERQVLLALHWNLYVSNNEFKQFFTLFKNQITKRLKKNIEIDDSTCFKFLPHLIEYLALTSLVLIGSSMSILTAIHLGTLTHSTLMKTFDYPQPSILNDTNTSLTKRIDHLDLGKYSWLTNETTDMNFLSHPRSSCSINILQPSTISRTIVESFC